MKTHCAKTKSRNVQEGWQTVLSDVEREMATSKKRLSDLHESLRIIKEKIRIGEPFPSELVTNRRKPLPTNGLQ
jgi:hypothetical protein